MKAPPSTAFLPNGRLDSNEQDVHNMGPTKLCLLIMLLGYYISSGIAAFSEQDYEMQRLNVPTACLAYDIGRNHIIFSFFLVSTLISVSCNHTVSNAEWMVHSRGDVDNLQQDVAYTPVSNTTVLPVE